MVKVSTLAIAGGTLLLAAGAGLYMQMSGGAQVSPQVAALSTPGQTPLELDRITLTSSELPPAALPLPERAVVAEADILTAPQTGDEDATPVLAALETEDRLEDRPAAPTLAPLAAPSTAPADRTAADDCLIDMTGETRAAAMVALHLIAPCAPGARVTLKHAGMVFAARTDDTGVLDVEVPALAETANFLAMLEDGNGAAVEVDVDTLAFYDRSVVQWQGDAGVELHALEFGAGWDDAGHVWSGAPRDATVAARGEGGFLTRLGDATLDRPQIAEVYTFPTGTAKTAGDIALSVEIEVTQANCGQELTASVIEVAEAHADKPGALTLSVPGCDAVGDFIQLKNLVRDLKVAAR